MPHGSHSDSPGGTTAQETAYPADCLLEAVLQPDSSHAAMRQLNRFLAAEGTTEALTAWFGPLDDHPRLLTKSDLKAKLAREIARIDEVLNQQVNAVLHNEDWQRLESAWRGLEYLVNEQPPEAPVVIRVLDVSWKMLSTDAQRAIEFDQTQLFRKVYEEQFGTPGGRPFGLLLADFAVSHRVSPQHPHDDVATLRSVAQVAAAAFVPVIVSAHPHLFGADSFGELDRRLDLTRMLAQSEYMAWRSFVSSEDSRYIGVVVPQVLMRRPWERDTSRIDYFPFEEDVQGPDSSRYLWGSAVYAFGAVVMRSFSYSGWFEDILGTQEDSPSGGGIVESLPVHRFAADGTAALSRFSTDVLLTDEHERGLSLRGFIPLCHSRWTDFAAFHSAPSLHQPQSWSNEAATRNDELSSRLNLMLCVCRFAHYLKVIVRDRTGRFNSPVELETHLHNWIHQYVSADTTIAPSARARFPLREARVQIREAPGRPGVYLCETHLRPHLQGDQAVASMKLLTEVAAVSTGRTRAGAAG